MIKWNKYNNDVSDERKRSVSANTRSMTKNKTFEEEKEELVQKYKQDKENLEKVFNQESKNIKEKKISKIILPKDWLL